MPEFTCNICGKQSPWKGEKLDREAASCNACGSNLRTRGLIHALTLELFGLSMPLPDFPRVRSLRGLGASDPAIYADSLAAKFDYRNTFYDRPPRLDIIQPPEHESGLYDFLISSEIFEHTAPPPERAFEGAARLLNARGVLLMTVPYQIDASHIEHFPGLHEYGLVRIGDGMMLINRGRDGRVEVFDDLIFHRAFGAQALEMREFSEDGLRALLTGAGFNEIRVYGEDYPPFGIAHAESWSLPVAARKNPGSLESGIGPRNCGAVEGRASETRLRNAALQQFLLVSRRTEARLVLTAGCEGHLSLGCGVGVFACAFVRAYAARALKLSSIRPTSIRGAVLAAPAKDELHRRRSGPLGRPVQCLHERRR